MSVHFDDHGGRTVVKDSGDRIVILGLSQNEDLNERLTKKMERASDARTLTLEEKTFFLKMNNHKVVL